MSSNKALPEFPVWSHQFLLIKEAKNSGPEHKYLSFSSYMPDIFINTSMTVFLFHLIVSISVYIQVSAPFICGLLASCFIAPKIVTLSKRARHFGFKFFKFSVVILPFYTIVTKGL